MIQKSVLYDNVGAAAKQNAVTGFRSHVELDDSELDRLREAQDAFRNLASRMRAFALNDQYAERALGNRDYFLNKPPGIGGDRKDHVP